jgi:hypothetical protein
MKRHVNRDLKTRCRHCERGEAIQKLLLGRSPVVDVSTADGHSCLDCFAPLAMTALRPRHCEERRDAAIHLAMERHLARDPQSRCRHCERSETIRRPHVRPSPVIIVSINGGQSGLDCFALLAMTALRPRHCDERSLVIARSAATRQSIWLWSVTSPAIRNLDAVIASAAKQSRGLT